MSTVTLDRTLEERIEALEAAVRARAQDKVCMVVFSGDLDKVLAAFTIATGAAAMGTEVCMFFTFWATPFLKRERRAPTERRGKAAAAAGSPGSKRSTMDRAFGLMLPPGEKGLKLSRLHMAGAGKALINKRMRDKNIAGLGELLSMAEESGVRIKVCDMSMDLMGIRMDDLITYPALETCGVATFMEHALDSSATLFI
jgi:peroxiredoxin family protein